MLHTCISPMYSLGVEANCSWDHPDTKCCESAALDEVPPGWLVLRSE